MKKKLIYALIAIAGVALDQIVKYWARVDLQFRPGGEIAVWPGVFYLRYTENRGAAFGILQGQRWTFVALTCVVALGILYVLFIRKPALHWLPGIPVAAMLAGAVGNLIDRAFLGYVTDLFDARFIQFAVFNVADALLVCSVIVVAIWVIHQEIQAKRRAKESAAEQEMDPANVEEEP